MRAATIDERRDVLARRLVGVEDRWPATPRRRPPPSATAATLVAKERAYARGRAAGRRADRPHRGAARAAARRAPAPGRARRAPPVGSSRRCAGSGPTSSGSSPGLREQQQRREVDDAENRMRLEAVVERIRTDFDCEPAVALDAPTPEPIEGTTLAGRARDLDRELRLMGPINPLALEEYDALLERHDFLQQQLEDVKNSRRELQRVIKAVDKEIVTVFETAFADVQENFTAALHHAVPGWLGAHLPHRPRRPAQHRHRDGGAPVGQEHPPAVAALRWRALAHRDGVPLRRLPCPPLALLPARRGRGRARRREPAPVPRPRARVPQRGAAADRLAPEAHDGGRRLPLRRVDGPGCVEPGREPADAGRGRPDCEPPGWPRRPSRRRRLAACGPPGKQSWLCSTVYDITGSQRAARDRRRPVAAAARSSSSLLIAYLLVRISRIIVRRVVQKMQQEETGETASRRSSSRTGLALLDTSPVPSVRRALRAETIGAVLRSSSAS